ncbi:glycosyltransferase, partial [Chromatiaceae bacterium AAb-1]|nr:glycosyltransferase [Chromatiaceae bacterium AAb-1]
KKIGVIHNPVNKLIESYVVNNGISDLSKKSYILCVGRLEKQKAFHYAIIAFSRIIEQYPDLRLKIVGKGILEPQLRALCDELQISNLVDFEGFNQDVISYYLEAKLTLLTSLYEGFPNVLVESISLGTPVVAVDCQSGPREIITKDNGYLVPPADLDALVGAISKALNREWDVEAILTSSEKFSLQYAIAKYEELLR